MGCDQVVFGGKLQCISPGPLIPQDGSGQFMGKLPWEYLKRRALEIANYSRTADEREREKIFSKSLMQVSHPLPTCPGPTVWIWENDPNGFPVKRQTLCCGTGCPLSARVIIQISEPHVVQWSQITTVLNLSQSHAGPGMEATFQRMPQCPETGTGTPFSCPGWTSALKAQTKCARNMVVP